MGRSGGQSMRGGYMSGRGVQSMRGKCMSGSGVQSMRDELAPLSSMWRRNQDTCWKVSFLKDLFELGSRFHPWIENQARHEGTQGQSLGSWQDHAMPSPQLTGHLQADAIRQGRAELVAGETLVLALVLLRPAATAEVDHQSPRAPLH